MHREMRSLPHRITLLVGLVALVVAVSPAAARELVYAPEPAADAVYDAGVVTALRQAPIADITNPRWPVSRRVGKVSGSELARMSSAKMVEALRAAWSWHPVGREIGGTVAVDEIRPSDWTAAAAANLAQALRMLGPDASRVFIYVSPAVVERIGRTDPRQALDTQMGAIFNALSTGGVTYLEMYRGDLSPYPPREMAMHPTRWLERWPAARRDALRVLIGPGGSTGQAEIWNRIRSTPAGRTLLSNGPGYYTGSGGTAADGAAWAAQLARYRAAPDTSPTGADYDVPVGGGVVITPPPGSLRPGGTLRLTTNRAGAAVVRLITSSGRVRIIKGSLRVGADGVATITLPRDLRAGNYRLTVTFQGEGLKDTATVAFRVGAAPSGGNAGFRERLLEGQRVAQDAVRLLNAIDAWLNAGITTGDLAPEGFGPAFVRTGQAPVLAAGLRMVQGAPAVPAEPLAARPITPAPAGGGSGTVRVTPAQLLINQRISQAAVVRANALEKRLREGLTGGDLVAGAITPGKLAPGLRVAVDSETPTPERSVSVPARIERGSVRGLRVTSAQLSINLRISQAALARAQALSTRLTAGLTEDDFRAGSVAAANLAPGALAAR